MLSYYKQEALTAETVRDGWLHTGDLGYVSGGELFVCGRLKDLIMVHGRKYHPQDLEWAVGGLAGIRRGRVVAFGSADRGRADRVVIVVEPNGTVQGDALTEAIRRRIADLFGLYVDDVALVPSGTVDERRAGKCSARRPRRATSAASSPTPPRERKRRAKRGHAHRWICSISCEPSRNGRRRSPRAVPCRGSP